AEGVASALSKLGALRPALILLDAQVLDTNGSRLARRLLADEQLVSIPIIALIERTTSQAGKVEPCGGFDGYLVKPVDGGACPGQVRAFLDGLRETPQGTPLAVRFPAASIVDRRRQAAELLDAIQ